ncbi:hypothetical protein QQG55_56825 [Brugia pahangi]
MGIVIMIVLNTESLPFQIVSNSAVASLSAVDTTSKIGNAGTHKAGVAIRPLIILNDKSIISSDELFCCVISPL